MSNKDLKREPHMVHEDFWWYEEPKGITMVMRGHRSADTFVFTIPWKAIRNALKRKDKK